MNLLYVNNRAKWREWLVQHYADEAAVWLVFYRKETGKPSIAYDAAVEEALCFGWIDSIIKKLDAQKYARKFTPRTKDSYWSNLNKQRAAKMITEGRMTQAGMALIETAKHTGRWKGKPRPELVLTIHPDFRTALKANPLANKHFDTLSQTSRKQYIIWINTAKRPETRAKRINEAVTLLAKGEKLGLK
jgi:uncharacterized protein YdeI (YjbR/CyaY-like superfamily)